MDVRVKVIEVETRLRIKGPMRLAEVIFRGHLAWSEFAGSLTGAFGTAEETLEFVRGEREAWRG